MPGLPQGKFQKKNTLTCYQFILFKLQAEFGQRDISAISQDDILSFLSRITAGNKQNTKRNRFTTLSAFFNFIITAFDLDLKNPCETPILQKMFKRAQIIQWNILEKDTVDEIIFRTTNPRNRIMLELMSRAGMRISEVLKLTPTDTDGRKLTLRNPKSGKDRELVYIPQRLSNRLEEYIRMNGLGNDERIFPITYTTARYMVRKAGKIVDVFLRPHDLRRFAATYASRSGAPIEIVSKVILRHANLSTTQRYLGKVSDIEAMRWIENLYG
jgi:integrase/recombinase XerD